MDPLDVDGAWTFTPLIHQDRRGSFLECFRGAELTAELGHCLQVAQANCSVSRRGVLRGIHFAEMPPGQAKYVTCVSGAVLDVVVDLRVGSPSFGQWTAVSLNDQTRRAVYVAEGLGHGFVTLTDEATVLYLCSAPYAPGREHGVDPFDPDIGINWPEGLPTMLSDKDAKAPSLRQAQAAGILPRYEDCLAYAEGLREAQAGGDRWSADGASGLLRCGPRAPTSDGLP
jgi:dTDP-4-dehydrorhamnose 3,5-epimerase